MRAVRHLNPRYVYDRVGSAVWQRRHPDAPWLTPEAVAILDRRLRNDDVVLEWGSGRSTAWFARRTRRVVSIEHQADWYARVGALVAGYGDAVERHLFVDDSERADYDSRAPYVAAAGLVGDGEAGLVLVDGAFRDACALAGVPKVRPGGLLVVDNANWFLPHASRSPSSRGADGTPASERWRSFLDEVADWPIVWTSCGVTDTALWTRPG